MRNLVFVKKENIKADLTKKMKVKSAFFVLSKSSGITLIALVISIIVILILAGISLNATIGNGGIISNAQNSKLKSEVSNAESEILTALATLDTEYYQKASSDFGVNIDNIYSISGLQKYVNGKINGFNYNKDGETVVYYTNNAGSYTVKIRNGKATTYSGIYITEGEYPYIYMSTESGNNTIYLSSDLEDVVWASLKENIATVDPKTGVTTKKEKGTVTIVGESNGKKVYVTIWDDEYIENGSDASFAKEVNVVESKETVDISATASDSVEASIVINDKGETVLQISGTGNMFDSVIEFSETGYYSEVTNIVIEDGVKNITENALNNFTKAKSITIASTVEKIHTYYLCNLEELTTINMNAKKPTIIAEDEDGDKIYGEPSETITNIVIGEDVEEITDYEFIFYYSIKSIMIPNNVKNIGESAFECCENLENIILPNKLTSIGEYAFAYCTNMEEINIPNSVKIIGDYAFSYCESLKSITIPESVTSIGIYAFNNCTSLKSIYYNAINCSYDLLKNGSSSLLFYQDGGNTSIEKIIIGNNVEKIPQGVFAYCLNVKEINIPDSVKEIEDYAFYYCTGITGLKIGKNVTSIGFEAFARLYSLIEVTIPENVTSIGMYAFYNCTSLRTIYYNAINCSYDFLNNDLMMYPLFYYQGSRNTLIEKIIIGDKVESIPEGIFSYLANLKEIDIPDSVKKIEDYAFYCNNVASLKIGNSVNSIGTMAFAVCQSLTEVTIPSSVTTIGTKAFYGCTLLSKILIKKPDNSISGSPWGVETNIPILWNQ
jgi:hypothetical protein